MPLGIASLLASPPECVCYNSLASLPTGSSLSSLPFTLQLFSLLLSPVGVVLHLQTRVRPTLEPSVAYMISAHLLDVIAIFEIGYLVSHCKNILRVQCSLIVIRVDTGEGRVVVCGPCSSPDPPT